MNIAIIVLDTLRRDKVSVYNDDVDFTENLERFSSNSAVYENAVAQGPWTLPSHASIFTGEYPWKHNATQETLYLEDEFKQLPEIFSEKGYSTGAFSDNPWISSSSGLERGFDQLENYLPDVVEKADESDYLDLKSIMNHGGWFIDFWFEHFGRGYKSLKSIQEKLFGEKKGERTRKVFDDSLKFMENAEDEFFLFANLMTVHYPKEPPVEYREKHLQNPEKELEEELSHETENGLEDVNVERAESAYDACADYLDDEFGRFMDGMREKGLMEDTAVLVLSDHGENLGEDDRVGHSFSVSDSLVEVPLMIYTPENQGSTQDQQVELKELYNILPSLAEGSDFNLGSEYAMGGYGYPDLDLKAAENMERARDSKLIFAKKGARKVVKEEERVGETRINTFGGSEDELEELDDAVKGIGS